MNQPADNNNTGRNKTGEKQFKHNLGRDLSFLNRELARGLMQKSVARGPKGLKLNWDEPDCGRDRAAGVCCEKR